jgi:hypothetical protein
MAWECFVKHKTNIGDTSILILLKYTAICVLDDTLQVYSKARFGKSEG